MDTAETRTQASMAPAERAGDARRDPAALAAENERLRARVAALESELVEVQARTDAVVAQWQERAYWLDRWHLDLNALMRRPGASEFRAVVRGIRSIVWALKRAKRSLNQP